jgi:hypothetical protein
MTQECVVDTTVLQKVNAPLTHEPAERSAFVKRVNLLTQIQQGSMTVLISTKLIAEYERQVRSPRNDHVRLFFELIQDPGRRTFNWRKRWSGADREHARRCRYPREDDHVLRTAIRPGSSTIIFTEEQPMLRADQCVYRRFQVHIHPPE